MRFASGSDTSPKANAAPAAEPEHITANVSGRGCSAESGGDVAADGNTGENDESKDRPRSTALRGWHAVFLRRLSFWRRCFAFGDPTRPSSTCRGRGRADFRFCGKQWRRSFIGTMVQHRGRRRWQRRATGRIFSRGPASSEVRPPALGVVATESNLPEARMPLPKAPDLPLPVAALERQEPALTIRRERAAFPRACDPLRQLRRRWW